MTDFPAITLDADALQRLRELDPTGRNRLLQRVMSAFESSSTRLAGQLHAARKHDDLEAIRLVAHTLKSSSASIGALALSRLCAEIEAQIRTRSAAGLADRLDALDRELGSVLKALGPMLKGLPS